MCALCFRYSRQAHIPVKMLSTMTKNELVRLISSGDIKWTNTILIILIHIAAVIAFFSIVLKVKVYTILFGKLNLFCIF